jgi:hypothetical protein
VAARPRPHRWSALLACAVAVWRAVPPAGALAAQERELTWPEVTVTARLDADGRLHVRERQVIRFTGDWNGGERTFRIPSGQRLTMEGITRLDSVTGAPQPMVEDDLDVVDGWRWDGTALRWRSRLPDDPPFSGTLRTYELAFRYANVLVPQDDGTYLLDHDFAFSEREGAIERFRVRLTIDPAWSAPAGFTGEYDAGRLEPGSGYVVSVPLRRVAAGAPAEVRFGASAGQKRALLAALAAGLALLFARLLAHDARLGRFRPVVADGAVTPAFLQAEVFSRLPEVVGAAWDDTTTSAEVAATLARLVQEGKLASRVESRKVLWFTTHTLHLTLRTDRDRLRDHELTLVNALFPGGARQTDTDTVRAHYAKTGFDPAALLDPQLRRLIPALLGGAPEAPVGSKWTALVAALGMVAALLLLAQGARHGDIEIATGLVGALAALPGFLVSRFAADDWRRRPEGLAFAGVGLFGGVGATAIAYWWVLLRDPSSRVHVATLAGLLVWQLTLAFNVTVHAWVRQTPERLAQRRRLAAARRWFQEELRRPEPQLRDEWYPWLMAFGLGPQVDRWFKAFGAAAGTRAVGSGRLSSSGGGLSSSSGSSGGGFTGFGGGGGFAGGGGGAAFGAAIGGMAATVAKPSSRSSGGGGGGGGGSSGGGGGGGW